MGKRNIAALYAAVLPEKEKKENEVELKKDLPAIFDDFADARKQAFLAVKEVKDKNKPVIGIYCTFFPQELAVAMDASVVSLCQVSDETIADAEQDLPKNLCPLIKASYGFGKTDKCPFFYFSDLVIAETTCDGKKKMYEYMSKFKPMHIIELPNSCGEDDMWYYRDQIIKTKEALEDFFGVTITEDDIRRGIRVKNDERSAIKKLYSIMKADPAPISGMDLLNAVNAFSFEFDRDSIVKKVDELLEKIEREAQPREKKPRILITGCPIGGATLKVVSAIEENGADVVFFEDCTVAKAVDMNVDETIDDVYEALSRKYVNIGCSCMTPNPNRFDLLDRAIDEYHVDGVVDMVLQACHTYALETKAVEDFVNNEKGIPYIAVETDYSQSDIGQLNTRLGAFIETL